MMKNSFLLTVLSILIAAIPMAARIQAGTPQLTASEAQADFDLMRRALEEAHAGLYRYSTKAELDRAFAAQREKLAHSLTQVDFMTVVAQSLAAIRCGHTSCEMDEQTEKAARASRLFPLRLLPEGKRLLVLFNDTPDNETILPGMELLTINGHKAADILERVWRTESADGDIQTGKSMHIAGRFGLLYWWLVEQTDTFTLTAADGAGKTVTATLSGVSDADRKKNRNPVNATILASIAKLNWSGENQSLRFLHDPDIAEIRLRYFVGDDYPKWVEETFKTLREKGAKALIIDLRGNGGGADMYGAMLVSYLTDKPFRYFDRIHLKTIAPSEFFKAHSDWNSEFEAKLRDATTPDPAGGYLATARLHHGLAEQSPGKYPFLGRVFVLIDGGTFSTAADFCAVAHHLKRATFVGEETGGGYCGNNSGPEPRFTLPNSKLRVRVPIYEYWNAVSEGDGARRGTRPDYLVQTRTASLLRGVDEPLDLAVRLAAGGDLPKR